jgi:hypothetical protein
MRHRGAFVKLGSVCVLFGGFLGKLVFGPRALCPRQLFFTADTFSRDSFTPFGASRRGIVSPRRSMLAIRLSARRTCSALSSSIMGSQLAARPVSRLQMAGLRPCVVRTLCSQQPMPTPPPMPSSGFTDINQEGWVSGKAKLRVFARSVLTPSSLLCLIRHRSIVICRHLSGHTLRLVDGTAPSGHGCCSGPACGAQHWLPQLALCQMPR